MPSLSLDTIAALATAPGRGGIAVVRVSGPLVKLMTQSLLDIELNPRQATYTPFKDSDGQVIDEGIAIFFPNPHSFTGEDVLELHGHGGPVVVDLLLQRLLSLGARLARPGEFSERAFLNGKMDLAQAEAVADLINASSSQAARSAIRSLQGEFSDCIAALNEKIIRLRMYIEAAIDFSDEEIDFLSEQNVSAKATTILDDLTTIQANAKQGNLLREGVTAVIVGEPNVGKSSLLNCLSGKELAIVTDIPGTTRDVLRDYILIDGMPMHIVDTAGLRESEDVVEREGIRRAYREMEQADVVLLLSQASKLEKSWSEESLYVDGAAPAIDRHIPVPDWQHINPLRPKLDATFIVVRNKIDLLNESPSVKIEDGQTVISLSARTGDGMDLLKQEIKKRVGFGAETDGVFLARRRHLDALARAEVHVKQSLLQLSQCRCAELAAEDLRQAHLALCEITGEFSSDDLLGHIFSSFCIGK